ncbi:hypothetical protein CDL15_Pgr012778 [Punica granatum]|uniref:Uncharacterized protein n=1 Tax=Punica granatum TaxID=22663 RepID=A0A218XEB9_PUNGR|nr:hypothetical protein CDL15_Pgr012778 [Punica granatum]
MKLDALQICNGRPQFARCEREREGRSDNGVPRQCCPPLDEVVVALGSHHWRPPMLWRGGAVAG